MVVERLLPPQWVEKKAAYAFFLGSIYSLIGIIIAKVLFPADPSLVAIAFTSILLLPLLRRLFSIEEKQEKHEKKFSLKHLFKDEGDFVKTYLLLALGIFSTYVLASMVLPGDWVNSLFRDQLELRHIGGQAFSMGMFWDILLNNWWVLLACFVLSLFTGDGAIFLITWNASLWGTIFGVTARNAALVAHTNPWWYLFLVLLIVMPHAIIELLSYIFAGIGGGLISADVESGERKKYRFRRVFYSYTGTIILGAVILLILGVVVETFVLSNVTIYRDIVELSYLFG